MIYHAAIALIGTLVCVCILFAAWIGLTERGRSTDDWFRTRWGGSDVRELHEPMAYRITKGE